MKDSANSKAPNTAAEMFVNARLVVLPWIGKATRGNENPGHGCEKQSVQSRKVLCRILTGGHRAEAAHGAAAERRLVEVAARVQRARVARARAHGVVLGQRGRHGGLAVHVVARAAPEVLLFLITTIIRVAIAQQQQQSSTAA